MYLRTGKRNRRIRGAADLSKRAGIGAIVRIVPIALLLGGCATSHIGSEWPCPASQGMSCTSVSAADPARAPAVDAPAVDAPAVDAPAGGAVVGGGVAGGGVAGGDYPEENQRPLYWPEGNGEIARARKSGKDTNRASERCLEGCRPFEWLGRLTGIAPRPERGAASGEGSESTPADAPENAREENALPESPSAGLADLPPAGAPFAGPADLPSAGLRTEEVVGRIWIAPYVDGNGVYHEASWVRVVLEPARWRLP